MLERERKRERKIGREVRKIRRERMNGWKEKWEKRKERKKAKREKKEKGAAMSLPLFDGAKCTWMFCETISNVRDQSLPFKIMLREVSFLCLSL